MRGGDGAIHGHTVQKHSPCDTKSDRREGFERHTANSGSWGQVGEVLDQDEREGVRG